MNFANKISIFRILTVPFFIATLIYYQPQKDYLRFIALGIFVLGAVSDAVDGYIARKAKQVSKAGMVLDPLGDKLLLMSSFIMLSIIDQFPGNIKLPIWVSLVVISRDVIILLGAVVIYIVKQNIDIKPTRWGKLTTTFQMASVIAVLLQLQIAFIFWGIAVFFTLISGMDYIKRGFNWLYVIDNRNHH
ncbi:MAG: CDP-alcohol phosphatidyltransferase family protein [Candidatus Omnitrophica bacterium]|jgi:cardiolipin synthase|nr:CDP-alcohol phosphatidyltransferase family protein [Candidatus Omnitrophota bacterium]